MNKHEWLSALLSGKRDATMPVLSFPSVQLMGITVRQLIDSADNQARGMKLIADRVPTAASVSMMDLSVEAEAFGVTARFSDDEVPTCVGSIVTELEDAQELKVPKVGEGRTGRYVEAIGKAKNLIRDRPVFAGIIGPFSLTGRLMDVTEALVAVYTDPDTVHAALAKTVEFIIDYINAYKSVGADGIVMADPLTGLLPPELSAEFAAPYAKQVRDAVADDNFTFIYHNCGNSAVKLVDSLLTINADAYHFGNAIKMADALAAFPSDRVLMGNIDPASRFRRGTPDEMRKAVRDLLAECGDKPNFVISSGCDIPPMSPWENIDAYFDEIKTVRNQ